MQQKLRRGLWSPEEDEKPMNYINNFGHGSWRDVPSRAGLQRCGKSCRLRWINYLRPDLKRGAFSTNEEHQIIQLHAVLGNMWSQIAVHLPGCTDNEIKNFWNSCLKKKSKTNNNNSSSSDNDYNTLLKEKMEKGLVKVSSGLPPKLPFLLFDNPFIPATSLPIHAALAEKTMRMDNISNNNNNNNNNVLMDIADTTWNNNYRTVFCHPSPSVDDVGMNMALISNEIKSILESPIEPWLLCETSFPCLSQSSITTTSSSSSVPQLHNNLQACNEEEEEYEVIKPNFNANGESSPPAYPFPQPTSLWHNDNNSIVNSFQPNSFNFLQSVCNYENPNVSGSNSLINSYEKSIVDLHHIAAIFDLL